MDYLLLNGVFMIKKLIKTATKRAIPRNVLDLLLRFWSVRHYYLQPKIIKSDFYINSILGKNGLEIGGPSVLFRTVLPVYQSAKRIDGVNFSTVTAWEGVIDSGLNYTYLRNRKGWQFISDATDLSQIENETYDFVLSSNCLEHIANPVAALREWGRVLKPEGILILVLPNKASNFDHARPFTVFEHIVQDYESGVREDDLTHLAEILQCHDLTMDSSAGSIESFRERSRKNYENRMLHHHVFDLKLVESVLIYSGFDVLNTTETNTDLFSLAKKADIVL